MATSKNTAAAKRGRQQLTERQAEKIFSDFLKQPAQLTVEQARAIESRLMSAGERGWRQALLLTLSRSGVELRDSFTADKESAAMAAQLIAAAKDMASRLHDLAGLLKTAETRLRLVLCERADMEELLAAAESPTQAQEVSNG